MVNITYKKSILKTLHLVILCFNNHFINNICDINVSYFFLNINLQRDKLFHRLLLKISVYTMFPAILTAFFLMTSAY